MKLKTHLNALFVEAFAKAKIDAIPISVTEASQEKFGDYQFNGAMALSKQLGKNPREIATEILNVLDTSTLIAKAEIAGPGFINLWLNDAWLSEACQNALQDDRLSIALKSQSQTVVVDYSGPNMAKEMHVGHLRSTIIGDTLANLLSFLGDRVIRQNHIGDWGTQFGMLVAYLEEQHSDTSANLQDLESFYKAAKSRFDSDEAFANKAREYVVRIQSNDAHCLALWQLFIDISLQHCEEVYRKLSVKLTREDVRAESFYNDDLANVIDDLNAKGILRESEGALCVFLEGSQTPVIVQKKDGGYLYATTDLAALRYRAKTLHADRVLYVVDARQAEHFKQVFEVAKMSDFVPQSVRLEHIGFGTMMDSSGKPFKTRDGGTVKLIALLDEAVRKAKESIKEPSKFTSQEIERLAQVVGIGAVKYADLSINRESNYIFDWDKMLAFDGNTALYMQYAYARIQSIFRKHNRVLAELKITPNEQSPLGYANAKLSLVDSSSTSCFNVPIEGKIVIVDPLEHQLAVMLLRFEEVLIRASEDASPNQITAYLYEVVTLFMRFYEQNPILKEGVDEKTKMSRLQLANLVARTIRLGLEILGIEVVDQL